ncbi:MAG: hypothetical protein HY819_20305 [Acidobacteria bacterium]|nr:hypothetical protein [Acidobacteriota bacterium]
MRTFLLLITIALLIFFIFNLLGLELGIVALLFASLQELWRDKIFSSQHN